MFDGMVGHHDHGKMQQSSECGRESTVIGLASFDRSAAQRNRYNPQPPLSLFAGT